MVISGCGQVRKDHLSFIRPRAWLTAWLAGWMSGGRDLFYQCPNRWSSWLVPKSGCQPLQKSSSSMLIRAIIQLFDLSYQTHHKSFHFAVFCKQTFGLPRNESFRCTLLNAILQWETMTLWWSLSIFHSYTDILCRQKMQFAYSYKNLLVTRKGRAVGRKSEHLKYISSGSWTLGKLVVNIFNSSATLLSDRWIRLQRTGI